MSIKVIFTKDVPEVARAGAVKSVAPGYARNFLYPRGLALPASDGNLRQLELKRKRADELAAVEKAEASKAAEALSRVELRFTLKAGEQGQLYGSVSQAEIAEALAAKGVAVDRKKVLMRDHIKRTGLHLVEIRLHGEVNGKVRVIVDAEKLPEPEKPEPAPAEAEAAEGAEAEAEEAPAETPPE